MKPKNTVGKGAYIHNEIREFATMKANKFDSDKPPISLLPRAALEGTAAAFNYGAQKYGKYNFKKGMEWSRMLDAAMRHLVAFADKEDLDPESGLSHLDHAGACIAMLQDYLANNLGEDDRYEST